MIADIFYPILTLTITVLACFIREKKLFEGFAPTPSISCRRGPGLQLPLAAIVFGFAKNQCAHIFSVLSRHQRYSLIGK